MSQKVQRNTFYTKRLNITLFLVIFLAAVAVVRLFFLQIINHGAYLVLADKQQGFERILEPKRGDIYFKNKNGDLTTAATTKVGALIFLNTKLLKNPSEVYTQLNSITPINQNEFFKIAAKQNDPYEILKHKISLDEASKIAELKLSGVGLQEERWRFYPAENLASHLLGFVSSADDSPEGRYGAEKRFNSLLEGITGKIKAARDARGTLIALSEQFKTNAEEGEDIILTIEPIAQGFIEAELKKLETKWHARSGGILVLEPATGQIRAMASFPDFNPNEFQKEKNLGVFLNPFVEKIFELGSVFKPLTMAAALDAGAITPDTTYIDKGEVKIGDMVIKNFDGKARGKRVMTQILEESLNTGAVFVMQQIGGEKLKEYFKKFGLGDPTGIELPGEVRGNLSNLDSGREVEFATASFGQGIAVTPLEFAMALSALANGGRLMRPIVLEKEPAQIIREVVKLETSVTITKMLVDVVDTALVGGQAKKPGYSIAAKTGTAQIPDPESRGYYSDQFLHSFFGYFPAYKPQFMIFMFLERPQGVKYASQSLTGTFSEISDFLINYYIIPPDR